MANRQKISLLLLAVAIFGIIGATAVSAVKTVTLTTGQETGFWVWEGEPVEVYYSPNQQGNKMFSTWHKSLYHFLYADDPNLCKSSINEFG